MDIRLRNGKTLSSALEELSAYAEPKHKNYAGKPYHMFREYQQRFDAVFGASGYSVLYYGFETVVLPCVESCVNQSFAKVCCTISIYGEDGAVVLKASGVGTKEIERDKAKLGYVMLNNMGIVVQQSAFKSAAKTLNIFDCNRVEDEEDSHSNSHSNGDRSGAGQNTSASKGTSSQKETKKVSLYVDKPIEVLSTDQQSGMPTYLLVGHEIIGGKCRQKPSKVIIYPGCYKKQAEKINDLLARTTPFRVVFAVTDGKPEKEYEGVYIFKNFG